MTPLTADAVALDLAVPAGLAAHFAYLPGQYVTLRVPVDGVTARRSYSLCTTPQVAAEREALRIGVARVERGLVSTWLTRGVRAGDVLDVAAPRGAFVLPARPAHGGSSPHHVALVAGSGITPVLPLLTTALDRGDRATLVFGNRNRASVMFAAELDSLAARHPDRLRVDHVFSREATGGSPAGRLDAGRVADLLDSSLTWGREDDWYVCGPLAFVAGARGVLVDRGVPAHLVHEEAFHTDAPDAL